MGFIEKIFKKSVRTDDWEAKYQSVLRGVSYDELVTTLGKASGAKGGFVYWRGPLTDLDPDYPEEDSYQLSDNNFRKPGAAPKKSKLDREDWFVLATSENAIRLLANDVGAMATEIDRVDGT